MTYKPQYHLQQHITNLNDIKELAAWPDTWVLRGDSPRQGDALYGFDLAARQPLWTLTGVLAPEGVVWTSRRYPLLAAAASPDGKVAFVLWRGTIAVLWGKKFEHAIPPTAHPGPRRRLNAAAFSPDSAQVAAAGGFYGRGVQAEDRRGRVFVWQLPEMAVRELVTPHDNRWFGAVAWSPAGLIATGARNGVICLFDAASGTFLGEIVVHGAPITALAFTATGHRLFSGSGDGSVAVLKVNS